LKLFLFPFKAYVIIIPVWAIVQSQETFYLRDAQSDITIYILAIHSASFFVFVFAAIVQFIAHHRRSAIGNALFALVAFLGLLVSLPLLALAK
jgi:hypothetical protein